MKVSDSKIAQATLFATTGFLHKYDIGLGKDLLKSLLGDCEHGRVKVISDHIGSSEIYYRYLAWDSAYFGIPTYRIDLMVATVEKADAIEAFRSCLSNLSRELGVLHRRFYIFAEIPSEAICPIQALCLSEWRMVETRLTYYSDRVQSYEYPRRFAVRSANEDDRPGLRLTAIQARNNFDRFHADFFFSTETADGFLATFIENSINGFADITLVPNADGNPPDAFLTANILTAPDSAPKQKVARMVLSAVGEKRRGWYVKLISEMSFLFKDKGIDIVFMTTQSTNKSVIRTWEKLGYSFGKSTHVFVHIAEG